MLATSVPIVLGYIIAHLRPVCKQKVANFSQIG